MSSQRQTKFKPKEWVVQKRGRYRGRVGTIHAVRSGRYCTIPSYIVQFGPSGPFTRLQEGSLECATRADAAKTLGCGIEGLGPDIIANG